MKLQKIYTWQFWNFPRYNDSGDKGKERGSTRGRCIGKSGGRKDMEEDGRLKCAHQVLGVSRRSGPSALLDAWKESGQRRWWCEEDEGKERRLKGGKRERGGGNGEKGERRGGVATEGQLIKQTESRMYKHYYFLWQHQLFPLLDKNLALQEWTKLKLGWRCGFPKKEFSSEPCGGFWEDVPRN